MNGDFYRVLTASLLHSSPLHLIANVIALLYIGSLLEKKLGWKWTLIIYLSSDIFSSCLFYGYMSDCINGNGSSVFLYSLMAILLILWLRYPNLFQVKWYNFMIIYLICYFFIGNFMGNYSTIIIHAFSFCVGLVEGLLLLQTSIIKR
ncbi:rhomboid family intramembrane serine protease [Anaerosporobacter sp.]|uniref:rhomboid family intramembrane serine protease n=1 Tax=Anaerosporobacter sp. TaxID=1872529 RepID=UPI003FA49E36